MIPGEFKHLPIACIDLETTGLNPWKHEILEVGVVIAKQTGNPKKPLEEVDAFDVQIIPEHLDLADEAALRVNHYHDRTWDRQIPLTEAVHLLESKLRGTVMVGQNPAFDFAFLHRAFDRCNKNLDSVIHYHKVDTASMAFGKEYWNRALSRYSLRELTNHFGIENTSAHTALSDARATFELAQHLLRG